MVKEEKMETDSDETKVLQHLIDAFSSTFSLKEIAKAYCKARRNPDLAGQILYSGGGQDLNNNAASVPVPVTSQSVPDPVPVTSQSCTSSDCADRKSPEATKSRKPGFSVGSGGVSDVVGEGCSTGNTPEWPEWPSVGSSGVSGAVGEGYAAGNTPEWPEFSVGSGFSGAVGEGYATGNTPESEWPSLSVGSGVWGGVGEGYVTGNTPEWPSLSGGSGSGVVGEGYAIHNIPAWGPVSTTKPLGVDVNYFPVDRLIDNDDTSDSSLEEDQMLRDPYVAGKVTFEEHPRRTIEEYKTVRGRRGGERNNPHNQNRFGKDGQFTENKIFVGGLPHSLTKEEFKAYFEKFGRTIDVVLPYDFTAHRFKGFGFIVFDSWEAVENATQKRFHELNGKSVEVKRFLPKDGSNNDGYNMGRNGRSEGSRFDVLQGGGIDVPASYDSFSATEQLEEYFEDDFAVDEVVDSTAKEAQMHSDKCIICSRPSAILAAAKVPLEKHVTPRRTVEVRKDVSKGEHNNPHNRKGFYKSNDNIGQFETKKIFVGGLSFSLTEEEFKAYFEKFGRITEAVIMYNSIKRIPRGFGFVTFDSREAVENVMQKRFHELNGKAVEVKRAVSNNGSSDGQVGGYNMRKNDGRGGSRSGYPPPLSVYASAAGYPSEAGGDHMGAYGAVSDGGTPVLSPGGNYTDAYGTVGDGGDHMYAYGAVGDGGTPVLSPGGDHIDAYGTVGDGGDHMGAYGAVGYEGTSVLSPGGDHMDAYGAVGDGGTPVLSPGGDHLDAYGAVVDEGVSVLSPGGDHMDPYGAVVDEGIQVLSPGGDHMDMYGAVGDCGSPVLSAGVHNEMAKEDQMHTETVGDRGAPVSSPGVHYEMAKEDQMGTETVGDCGTPVLSPGVHNEMAREDQMGTATVGDCGTPVLSPGVHSEMAKEDQMHTDTGDSGDDDTEIVQ